MFLCLSVEPRPVTVLVLQHYNYSSGQSSWFLPRELPRCACRASRGEVSPTACCRCLPALLPSSVGVSQLWSRSHLAEQRRAELIRLLPAKAPALRQNIRSTLALHPCAERWGSGHSHTCKEPCLHFLTPSQMENELYSCRYCTVG